MGGLPRAPMMTATCTKCDRPAVTHLRYAGTRLCRDHFLRFFDERAKHEVARQGRLPSGRIAVALSGGKDSVSLLHWLHGLVAGRPDVELVAVTVDEGITGYRDATLPICKRLTEQLGVPWHTIATKDLAGYTIDDYAAGRAGPDADGKDRASCGACGVFRRTGMNRLARELGCNAIATGHNLDDQAQTILMNHLKGDLERAARLAPHAEEDAARHPGLVPRLMPFRHIPEKEVLLYAILNDLPIHQDAENGGECPYAQRSHRFFLRDMLVKLEEQTPGTRHALVRGQDRLKPILAAALPSMAVVSCPTCGEPTSGASCVACSLRSS